MSIINPPSNFSLSKLYGVIVLTAVIVAPAYAISQAHVEYHVSVTWGDNSLASSIPLSQFSAPPELPVPQRKPKAWQ